MPTAAVVALPAQQGQAGAAADSVHDEHAAQQPAVTDQPVECEQVGTHAENSIRCLGQTC